MDSSPLEHQSWGNGPAVTRQHHHLLRGRVLLRERTALFLPRQSLCIYKVWLRPAFAKGVDVASKKGFGGALSIGPPPSPPCACVAAMTRPVPINGANTPLTKDLTIQEGKEEKNGPGEGALLLLLLQ